MSYRLSNKGVEKAVIEERLKSNQAASEKEWADFEAFLLALLLNAACPHSKPFPLAALTAMHELGNQYVHPHGVGENYGASDCEKDRGR